MAEFQIKTEFYQGELGGLVEEVREEKLDIFQVSLREVTQALLEYLREFDTSDLEMVGDLLVMLATLHLWKSQRMLPTEEIEEEPEGKDWENLKKEYEEFHKIAERLKEKELEEEDYFWAGYLEENEEEELVEVGLAELIEAFSRVLRERYRKKEVMEIIEDEFTVTEKMEEILKVLEEKRKVKFSSLFLRALNKIEMVVIFLALLELVKLRKIAVYQRKPFDEIWVKLNFC